MSKDLKASKVLKDPREPMVKMVPRDLRVLKDRQVQMELTGKMVLMESQHMKSQ